MKTSSDVVREIMFLFGVEHVSSKKFEKATGLVREIWKDGFQCGEAMQKSKPALFKKIKSIIHGNKTRKRP